MKSKAIRIFLTVVLAVVSIAAVCTAAVYHGMFVIHQEIVSSKPDTSSWILTNDEYKVVPTIDKNVTFEVKDKNDNTVFVCPDGWRSWDFKELSIDKDNNITAESGDMGTFVYQYSNGTWRETEQSDS